MRKPFLLGLAVVLSASGGVVSAQMLNAGEALASYKDSLSSGIRLSDTITPRVAAKTRAARAMRQDTVAEESALEQPDGTLLLPRNQTNLVIRTDPNKVTQGADGSVRVNSPTFEGDVNGNVTLIMDGKGPDNITVLNRR